MTETVGVHKTAVFKLHNPSQRRRALLLDAMKRAHRAYDKCLRLVCSDVEAMLGLSKRERNEPLRRLAFRLREITKPLPIGNGPKQAVQCEIVAAAVSYLELKAADDATEYPTCAQLNNQPAAHDEALERFAAAVDRDSESEARHNLLRVDERGSVRPLGIYKNRVSDGFLILRDAKDRLFAYINLHPADSRFANPVAVREMTCCRTGEVMNFTSRTGELFPLEAGAEFHLQRFLEAGTVASGRIVHRAGEFFLHVAFAFEAEAVEPQTWLGVDRGLDNIAGWAVVDATGTVLERGRADGGELRRRQRQVTARIRAEQRRYGIARSRSKRGAYADEAVHLAANAIATAAAWHRSLVVLEDLTALANGPHHRRPKGARRSAFNHCLNRAQYQKLGHVLGYKLRVVGLPVARDGEPLKVRPAFTSITCPACAHQDKASRGGETFRCVDCGHEAHADENAAEVIALKGMWWQTVGRLHAKKGERIADEYSFDKFLRDIVAARAAAVAGAAA